MPALPLRRLRAVPRSPRRSLFNPALSMSGAGQISSKVAGLTSETIQEIARPKDRYTIKDFKELLEIEPLSKACCELKSLRTRSSMGSYEHEDKEVQKLIRNNFEVMQGSLPLIVGQLASAMPFGFAVAEVVMKNATFRRRGQWRLETINILDPEKITFAGMKGRIKYVVYKDGGKKKYIDYDRCIHVVNGLNLANPYGSPEAKRAMPYYKAKQLLFAEMLVAGKNNATGILLAQSDSADTVQVTDAYGKPQKNQDGSAKTMSGPEALLYQLKNLESSGIIATDLKNRVAPLLIPSGDNFWNLAVSLVKKEILLSFLVPSLIFDEGSAGLGNTGLSGNHKSTLDSNIAAILDQIQDEIIEKVVTKLISWNLGYRHNWGSFESQPYTDPTMISTRATNLLSAISTGVIPSSDVDAINRLREDLGVSPINREQMLILLQQQIAQQQMQQGAAPTDPNAALMSLFAYP